MTTQTLAGGAPARSVSGTPFLSGRGLMVIQVVCVAIMALVVISPLFLLFVSSLKDSRFTILADMGSFAAFWVKDPSINNFIEVGGFSGAFPFGRYLLNSVVILFFTVTGGVIVNSMLAFVLAWGKIPGRGLMIMAVLALYVVPQETVVMPLLLVVNRLGMTDTYIVQILPWMASPIYIFLFYQFFREIPKDLVEAARVDGASFFRIYHSIFLPVSLPAMATVSILLGIDMWNQYLWPLLATSSNAARPISAAIAGFFGDPANLPWDQAMAASVLMMLPVLAFYIAFQRWFISSFIGSAVKG